MRAGWTWLFLLFPATAVHAAARDFDVLHYDLALVPDIARRQVTGQQTVQLRSGRPGLSEIQLDSGELKINSVGMNGRPLPVASRSLGNVTDRDSVARSSGASTEGIHWLVEKRV